MKESNQAIRFWVLLNAHHLDNVAIRPNVEGLIGLDRLCKCVQDVGRGARGNERQSRRITLPRDKIETIVPHEPMMFLQGHSRRSLCQKKGNILMSWTHL